jgi:Protein of unknown function (DUF1203)
MTFYRVVAIPDELANQTRASLKSPQYGHPAHVEVATGYGPCRSCLRTFQEGEEERILFTYNPFAGLDAYPSPGPVFIHREGCPRYEEPDFPADLRRLPLTLEAYGRGRWPVARESGAERDVEGAVDRLFAHPAVEYIHVRNTEAGCYIARIERAEEARAAA